jgi:hypothetical protein
MGTRLIFIDNIRWVMIMLVLSMHAAVTYSGHGCWYVTEPAKLGVLQDLTFLTLLHRAYRLGLPSLLFVFVIQPLTCYYVAGLWDTSAGFFSDYHVVLIALVGLTAVATFLVRIGWPMGSSFYNMQFCYFAEYIVFFVAGILAYRNSWLSGLPVMTSRRWGFAGLFGAASYALSAGVFRRIRGLKKIL